MASLEMPNPWAVHNVDNCTQWTGAHLRGGVFFFNLSSKIFPGINISVPKALCLSNKLHWSILHEVDRGSF